MTRRRRRLRGWRCGGGARRRCARRRATRRGRSGRSRRRAGRRGAGGCVRRGPSADPGSERPGASVQRSRHAGAVDQRRVQLSGSGDLDVTAVRIEREEHDRCGEPSSRASRACRARRGRGRRALRQRVVRGDQRAGAGAQQIAHDDRSRPASTAPTATIVAPSALVHDSAKVDPYLRACGARDATSTCT